MSDDQFTKLFKYMESFRADVTMRFEKVEHDIDDLHGTVAELSVDVKDIRQEFMVLSHQFDEFRNSKCAQ